MKIKKYQFLMFILLLNFSFARAQLKISGTVISEGPVEIKLTHLSDGNTYTLEGTKTRPMDKDGETTWKTKYSFPYGFEKNYEYAIRITDGTVEKTILIHGPVPEGIWPKQKYEVNIDLTDASSSDQTLVVYWSEIHDEYRGRPAYELERINSEAYQPLIWNSKNAIAHKQVLQD
jgi:hypothetical protein